MDEATAKAELEKVFGCDTAESDAEGANGGHDFSGKPEPIEPNEWDHDFAHYEEKDDNFGKPLPTISLLIVGKTGNGKSTLGNSILGTKDAFSVERGINSATTAESVKEGQFEGCMLKVMDTPYISTLDDMARAIKRWKDMFVPHAILLPIRCDVRYSEDEFAIYQHLKARWGESFCKLLIVVFTFGDQLDRRIDFEIEEACQELKGVMADARNRYVVFNSKTTDKLVRKYQVTRLLNVVEKLSHKGPEHRLLLVGKAEEAKRILGNILLARQLFGGGPQDAKTPRKEIEAYFGHHKGWTLKVCDTPDIQNLPGLEEQTTQKEVESWKQLMRPVPHAVLLTVRLDAPFTSDDLEIRRKMFDLWQNDAVQRQMIVVFTHGDICSDKTIDKCNPEINITNPHIAEALKEARNRYVVFFGKKSDRKTLISHLLKLVDKLGDGNDEGHEIRLLIIGKTGSGKSSFGNLLLGEEHFKVGPVASTTLCKTKTAQVRVTTLQEDCQLMVVNTPSIATEREVQSWKRFVSPSTYTILLAVNESGNLSEDEETFYLNLKYLFGKDEISKRLVVVFLYRDIDKNQRRLGDCGLKKVLDDAKGQYFNFSANASKRETHFQVKRFLHQISGRAAAGSVISSITSLWSKPGK